MKQRIGIECTVDQTTFSNESFFEDFSLFGFHLKVFLFNVKAAKIWFFIASF